MRGGSPAPRAATVLIVETNSSNVASFSTKPDTPAFTNWTMSAFIGMRSITMTLAPGACLQSAAATPRLSSSRKPTSNNTTSGFASSMNAGSATSAATTCTSGRRSSIAASASRTRRLSSTMATVIISLSGREAWRPGRRGKHGAWAATDLNLSRPPDGAHPPAHRRGSTCSSSFVSLRATAADSSLRPMMRNEYVSGAVSGGVANGVSPSERLLADVIDTVREPLLVLDAQFRVTRTNPAFFQTFRLPSADTIGKVLFDLGDGQWDIPPLRALLSDRLATERELYDVDVDHVFPGIGRKIMLLNARLVTHGPDVPRIILLAIEDVTERRLTERRLAAQRREAALGHVL